MFEWKYRSAPLYLVEGKRGFCYIILADRPNEAFYGLND
jgi:hypothetical protein